jgi:prepilin-type N-terminal cleavage/methylation domain-containing protein
MKESNQKKALEKGFTLIEILIVIGIIAILAAIVLVAINPARQFAQANNTQREANVNAILNAIGQYAVDNKGEIPGDISTGADPLADDSGTPANADICSDLVPTYLPALPTDPKSTHEGAGLTSCTGSYDTGYTVEVDSDGRVTVVAPLTEDVDPSGTTPDIEVTR